MQNQIHTSNIAETGYFSKLIVDYLQDASSTHPLIEAKPSIQEIPQVIQNRNFSPHARQVLVQVLQKQYEGISLTEAQLQHIKALEQQNTFTITTAHQPVIFSGQLYFIYKICHVIGLCNLLHQTYPNQRFVPVFYIGSEDADLDEVCSCTIWGKTFTWKTTQTGAVGRMVVDDQLIALINELKQMLLVLPYGQACITSLEKAYKKGNTISQSITLFIQDLFGQYGLLVINPDDNELKKQFLPIATKEVDELFSHKALQTTIDYLHQQGYHTQTEGRTFNLFLLEDNKRFRLQYNATKQVFEAIHQGNIEKEFTPESLKQYFNQHPQAISPNVILRGVFQETILPNLMYVGGAGEIAYWLQLKEVFKASGVPFPMLMLRHSVALVDEKTKQYIDKYGLAYNQLFQTVHDIMSHYIKQEKPSHIKEAKLAISEAFGNLQQHMEKVDSSLAQHTEALLHKQLQRLTELEKKWLRKEKRNHQEFEYALASIKGNLFPQHSLQERKDNVTHYWSKYNLAFITTLIELMTAATSTHFYWFELEK